MVITYIALIYGIKQRIILQKKQKKLWLYRYIELISPSVAKHVLQTKQKHFIMYCEYHRVRCRNQFVPNKNRSQPTPLVRCSRYGVTPPPRRFHSVRAAPVPIITFPPSHELETTDSVPQPGLINSH